MSQQSHRPKGLISNPSSRNRRIHREGEKIPIPSFSFTLSQENHDNHRTECDSKNSAICERVVKTGKENNPESQIVNNIQNSLSKSKCCISDGSKVVSHRVTDNRDQTTNCGSEYDRNKTVLNLSTEKGGAEMAAAKFMPTSCSNLNTKEEIQLDSVTSCGNSECQSSITENKEFKQLLHTDASPLCDTKAVAENAMTSFAIASDSSSTPRFTTNASTTQNNCSSSDHIKKKQSCHNDVGSSSVAKVVAAPTTNPLKPKSRKAIKTGAKRVKKEPTAKSKRKKTTEPIKAQADVIDLNSCSDSSLNESITRKPPPKKRVVTKKSSVKAGKNVKATAKDATTSQPNKSSKQTSTRKKSKSSASDEKKLCFACSTCKCNSREGSSATPQKLPVTLSGSNAVQERALINRLQKIERNVQWMESQKHDVGRQLMKHRNILTKKWEEANPAGLKEQPKFLADIDEVDSEKLNGKLEAEKVGRASILVFGEAKAKPAPKITLTQHFGCPSKAETSPTNSACSTPEYEDNLFIESKQGTIFSPIKEEPEIDEEEFIERRANAHLTSMICFAEAVAYLKQNNRTSSWDAATTATTIASKLDEILESPTTSSKSGVTSPDSNKGLDELLQLFAYTPSKSGIKPTCLEGDLVGTVDNQNMEAISRSLSSPLTPRGKQIAGVIIESTSNDPTKLAAVERACPAWRDNIKFVQLQTDPEQLVTALEAVKKAKLNIERMKRRIIQTLLDREQTLELFQQSLEHSINRLTQK